MRLPSGAPAVTLLLMLLAGILPRLAPPMSPAGGSGTPSIASLAARLSPPGLDLRPGSRPEIAAVGVASDGTVAWSGILSQAVAPDLQGYAGPVELLVGIGSGADVTGVAILRHNETPTFVAGIEEEWFLDQFKGKTVQDPLKPGTDLDGITQATVTVEAICAGVRRCLEYAAGSSAARSSLSTTSHHFWRPWVALLGALLVGLAVPVLPQRVCDALHAVLIGFTGTLFLSFGHLRILLRDPSSLLRLPLFWLVFFAGALLLLLTRPRGYCRHLCPCGRFQDALAVPTTDGDASPGTASSQDSPELPRGLGRTLLWSGLLALAFVPGFPAERLELFTPLFTLRSEAFGLLLIIAVAAGSLLTRRFYCQTLCPLNPLFLDLETIRGRFTRTPASEVPAEVLPGAGESRVSSTPASRP